MQPLGASRNKEVREKSLSGAQVGWLSATFPVACNKKRSKKHSHLSAYVLVKN